MYNYTQLVYKGLFMKFAIISNNSKDPDGYYVNKVKKEVEKAGGTVCFAETFGRKSNLSDAWEARPDIILSMGGDGTFLNIAGRTSKLGIPILGINIGSMGFLSGIEVNETNTAFKQIVTGNYHISSRMMISADVLREGKSVENVVALNDIVLSRVHLSRIVNIETHIDSHYVDTFPGDGIIVSTPTGSTGYSLSAGGPVIDHKLELMLITPICPHVMHSRPFVTGSDSEIKLKVNESTDYRCTLTADGQIGIDLFGGDEVVITKGPNEIKMVYIGNGDLYDTLRNKIYYRKARDNET